MTEMQTRFEQVLDVDVRTDYTCSSNHDFLRMLPRLGRGIRFGSGRRPGALASVPHTQD